MAITIKSNEQLKYYFDRVLEKANHHAKEVEEVALSIMGAVIWRAEGDIEVKETQEHKTGNILWFWCNGSRYALYYKHKTRQIELRAKNYKGKTLHKFDNGITQAEVFEIFSGL